MSLILTFTSHYKLQTQYNGVIFFPKPVAKCKPRPSYSRNYLIDHVRADCLHNTETNSNPYLHPKINLSVVLVAHPDRKHYCLS